MRNYKKLSNFVRKGTRLLLFIAMLMSLFTSSLTPASVALAATNNIVTVTVQDTAAALLSGRTVYVFDGTGIAYLGIFGSTDVNGQVTFDLATTPSSSYTFASDDVNNHRYFSAVCDVVEPCTAATIEEPVFGQVAVTVNDPNGAPDSRTVYAFNSGDTSYTGLSKVTNGSGVAIFDLPDGGYLSGSYIFGTDDVNSVRHYSTSACVVTGCTSATIDMPLFRSVAVTVQTTALTPISNRPVYVYDSTGTTYLNLMATTGAAGEPAMFNLPDIAYQFATDDINGHRTFVTSPAGDTTATITEPVFIPVTVNVTLGGSPIAGQLVYVFDGAGSTYLNLSDVSDAGGVAQFNLDNSLNYTFATDYSSMRYFSGVCAAACSTSAIDIPVFGGVNVTVHNANGNLANRVVYVFDGTGTTYLGIQGTTGGAGEGANFNLPSGDYTFRSDVNGYQYFSTPACTVPTCNSAIVEEPVFGDVAVNVLDGTLTTVASQTVYLFDETGTTYLNRSTVTDGSGVASFNLPAGSYTFASDLAPGQRFFSFPACAVTSCTSATIVLANVTDLSITKTVDQPQANAGSSIVFTIVASNAGPNPATNVVVNDLLPAGLTYASDDAGGAYVSGTGVWTIGSLAAGASATLHITATIDAGTDGSTIANSATISANQGDLWAGNETANASVYVGVKDLCATTGTVTMPDGVVVPIWGYAPGDCTSGAPAQLPGPTITAAEGNVISITLHNNLPVDTGLLFQGQSMAPDFVGVPSGGSKLYTFTASNPGTYLYELALLPNTQYQTAMGLYGALIVSSATAGQAYDDAATAYDDEALLVLSEIDPELNNSADPAAFDLRAFAAKYFLINGKAYPDTDGIQTQPGNTLLLRYVNASLLQHSMTTLGVDQQVIANDGSPLTYPHRMVAETFGPGQTVDILVDVSAGAVQGSKYPLYDGNLMLHNSAAPGFGGMLTFINVGTDPVPGADVLGPQVLTLSITNSPNDGNTAATLDAIISDGATGAAAVTAAEYFVDTVGADGFGTSMNASFGTVTVLNVTATLSAGTVSGLSDGQHVVYVHGQDAAGNWGSLNFVVLYVDKSGPVSTILSMTPNPTNGSVAVNLTATGDDRATGNSDVIAAEYSIDGGTAVPMDINITTPDIPTAPAVSLTKSFSVSGLLEGGHVVSVRSMDALGNWGIPTTVNLVIDQTGPVVDPISASPNPTNGRTGINSTVAAVRLTATLTDTVSNIKAAEGFIGTVGANGTGFLLIPKDGLFNSLTEVAYIDIPFSTIAQLADGNHTLSVHGKDAAGNWGAFNTTVLIINRTLPDIANMAIADNGPKARLTADATNAVNNIAIAEWFIGADPGQGNAVRAQVMENGAVAKLTADINVATRPNGTYTVNLRVMDAAGNWSNTAFATLKVNNISSFIPPEPGAIKQIFIPMLTR